MTIACALSTEHPLALPTGVEALRAALAARQMGNASKVDMPRSAT